MGATLSALFDREHGRRVITLDPNPRPALGADLSVLFERWLPRADIVKVSEEDLAFLCPGEPMSTVAHGWLGGGPSLVVVTRGAKGVYALASESIELPAPPVDVVDTVGAGDAFMAGLLAALERAGRLDRDGLRALRSDELTPILAYAQRVAAATCERVGADPPWLADHVSLPPFVPERPLVVEPPDDRIFRRPGPAVATDAAIIPIVAGREEPAATDPDAMWRRPV